MSEAAAAEVPEHKNIHAAKLAVMQEVIGIEKRKLPNLPYKTTTEEDTLDALRPVMIRHGIVASPIEVSYHSREERTSKKGEPMIVTTVVQKWEFVHVPSETSAICMSTGEAMDNSDKSTSKALTIAKKYALLQFFLLQTGEDADKTREELGGGRRSSGNNKRSEKKEEEKPASAEFNAAWNKTKRFAVEANVPAKEAWQMFKAEAADRWNLQGNSLRSCTVANTLESIFEVVKRKINQENSAPV